MRYASSIGAYVDQCEWLDQAHAHADGGPNADGTLPFKYKGQPDCGFSV
jgi:hypothetical protein